MGRQTNRDCDSVINDYTYIKTINILNTVSIRKNSFQNEVAQMLRNAEIKQGKQFIKKIKLTEQIIQGISKPELWFLPHYYTYSYKGSLKYFKGLRHYGVKRRA